MAQQTLIDPLDIISGSWRNFHKNFKLYTEFIVWMVLLSVAYWAIDVFTRTLFPDKLGANLVFGLASLPISLVFAAVSIGIVDSAAKTLQNKKAGVRESMLVGGHKLISFIWISILIGLMIALGLVLLVIPALIFAVWYSFAVNSLVVDDVRGRKALSASRKLVRNRWWGIFFRLVIPYLFYYFVIRFGLALIFLLLGSVLGDPSLFFGDITDINSVSNLHILATTIVPQVVYGYGLVLATSANLILWFDLKKSA